MAYPIHGKVVRTLKNDVATANTLGFELEFTVDLDEITAQGDDWKDWLPGCGEWGGKIEAMFDPSSTEQKALMDNIIAATPGTKLTDLKFQLEDSGDYFSGDVFVTSMPVSANQSGKVTCSFTVKGSGAPSLTIA